MYVARVLYVHTFCAAKLQQIFQICKNLDEKYRLCLHKQYFFGKILVVCT